MPYLKPGEMYAVQMELVRLMREFKSVRSQYLNGDFQDLTEDFLNRNPVTGEPDAKGDRVVKVNGVWVDVESVMNADKVGLPIEQVTEE